MLESEKAGCVGDRNWRLRLVGDGKGDVPYGGSENLENYPRGPLDLIREANAQLPPSPPTTTSLAFPPAVS